MSPFDRLADRIESVQDCLPPETTLHMARSVFSTIMYQEYTNARADGVTAESFKHEAEAVINGLGLPIFDRVDVNNAMPGKRQPSLRESLGATISRFIVLDELGNVFANSASSIVYGGSMKYGPFMNVRSGVDASDLDLLITTDAEKLDDLDWRGMMETSLIDERDKLTFFARFSLQHALFESEEIDITSQRFTVADQGYSISAHFMPVSFIDIAYPQTQETIGDRKNHHKYVRDYKERPFERTQVANYDMSRRRHDIPVYNKAAEGGFIASNPAYSIIEGHYVPGMYQNLVLPTPTYAFGSRSKVRGKFEVFAQIIAQQEKKEQSIDPSASIANTEPRQPIMPSNVTAILEA